MPGRAVGIDRLNFLQYGLRLLDLSTSLNMISEVQSYSVRLAVNQDST